MSLTVFLQLIALAVLLGFVLPMCCFYAFFRGANKAIDILEAKQAANGGVTNRAVSKAGVPQGRSMKFEEALSSTLEENAELYRRLAD